jgi:hypothetical protein
LLNLEDFSIIIEVKASSFRILAACGHFLRVGDINYFDVMLFLKLHWISTARAGLRAEEVKALSV